MMKSTSSSVCLPPATGWWHHAIVTPILILVFASRPAHAVITANGLVFDSMPAMFGLPWISNMEYQAYLQEMPGRPLLCASDEDPSLSLSNRGQHLNHQSHSSMLSEPQRTKDGIPVALLVSRGTCSFEEKAREAMKFANVDYIIVHDDRSRTQLVPMSASDTSEISNHLLFVSYETGLHLHQMLREQSNHSSANAGLMIAMDGQIPNGAYEPGYDDTEQWIMAAMSGFFAFVACIGCLLVCVQAGLLPAADVTMFSGEQLMTEDQVLKLPSVNYGLRDEPAHQTSCAICIEEYEEGDKLRELPCRHVFHTECIVPWLTERHTSCPLCKSEVLLTDDDHSLWSNQWLTSYGALLRRIFPWRYGRVLVPGDDHNESNPVGANTVVLQVEPTRSQGGETDPAVV